MGIIDGNKFMMTDSTDKAQRFRARACEIIYSYVATLAAMKNVPLGREYVGTIADIVVARFDASEVRRLAEMRHVEISADLQCGLDLCLDYEGARYVVTAFVDMARLSVSPETRDGLVQAVYMAVTGDVPYDNRRPMSMWRWPNTKALEHILVLRVGDLPAPCGPDELLQMILTPGIAEPITAPTLGRGYDA